MLWKSTSPARTLKKAELFSVLVRKSAASVVEQVKKNTSKMVITKLSPNVTDIVSMAKAVEAAGTDAIL